MLNAFQTRKPIAAALIALLFSPIIGALYLGRGRLAFGYLLLSLLLTAALFVLAHYRLIALHPLDGLTFLPLGLGLVGMLHCALLARRFDPSAPLKWYARSYNIIFVFMLLPIVVFGSIRVLAYEPFRISSASMSPALQAGDYLYANKYAYGYSRYSFPLALPIIENHMAESAIRRGDVVIFRHPGDASTPYVKRVIGLPGERIQMVDGHVYLNGQPLEKIRLGSFSADPDEPALLRYRETLPEGRSYDVLDAPLGSMHDNTVIFNIPQGHYFMLGDNRDYSLDSRMTTEMGFVPAEYIIGKADIVLWNGGTNTLTYRRVQ